MKLLKSFQDLQNETCEIWIDDLKNYWIGRRGSAKMNIYYQQVNDIFELLKKKQNRQSAMKPYYNRAPVERRVRHFKAIK